MAADSVHTKLQGASENIAFSREVYMTISNINICPLTILYKGLLNMMYTSMRRGYTRLYPGVCLFVLK